VLVFIIASDLSNLDTHPERFCPEAIAPVLPQELIEGALADAGVRDARRRKLPTALTVWIVILLCLFRNRSYRDLIQMLDTASAWRGLWKDVGSPTSSALSRARDRVGVAAMQRVYERSAAKWIEESEGEDFHGYRLTAIDGTCAKVPDTLKNDAFFGRPGSSRGRAAYPQLRLVDLMDVGTRLHRAVRVGPYRAAEIALARELIQDIPAGLLILLDRNFMSYDLLWDITQKRSHFIVRAKKNSKARVIRQLAPGDALVEINVPRHWRKDRPDMPRKIRVREIRYTPEAGKEEIRLFTSLTDASSIPGLEIATCYHERWSVETGFEEVKGRLGAVTTITRPVLLRSKTPERVLQEVWAHLIAHNVLRRTMVCAASSTPEDESSKTSEGPAPSRLSFTSTIHQFRDGIRDMILLPIHRLIDRYRQLLRDIARAVVPTRPGRQFPRAVKIAMSGYPLKRSARPAA